MDRDRCRRWFGVLWLCPGLAVAAGAGSALPAPTTRPAATAPTTAAAPVPPPYRHAASGLVFPGRMGGLTCVRAEQSADSRVGLSVGYRSEVGLTVTVYVYSEGDEPIPDGPAAPVVVEHFTSVKAAVQMAVARGIYEQVEPIADGTVGLSPREGAPRALYALYKLRMRGTEALSAVYLTGWRKHLIKVRVTYPAAAAKACEPGLQRFLAELAGVLTDRSSAPATAPARKTP